MHHDGKPRAWLQAVDAADGLRACQVPGAPTRSSPRTCVAPGLSRRIAVGIDESVRRYRRPCIASRVSRRIAVGVYPCNEWPRPRVRRHVGAPGNTRVIASRSAMRTHPLHEKVRLERWLDVYRDRRGREVGMEATKGATRGGCPRRRPTQPVTGRSGSPRQKASTSSKLVQRRAGGRLRRKTLP